MRARWRFRAVPEPCSSAHQAVSVPSYLLHNEAPIELIDTDDAALDHARALRKLQPNLRRVEVVSVGCPVELEEKSKRNLITIKNGHDAGWTLGGFSMPPSKYASLVHAFSFAAEATRGYLIEVRIQNADGRTTHVVLVDTTEFAPRLRMLQ